MIKFVARYSLLLAIFSGCQLVAPKTPQTSLKQSPDDDFDCMRGDPVSFLMVPTESLPAGDDLGIDDGTEVLPVAAGPESRIRLDLCLDEDGILMPQYAASTIARGGIRQFVHSFDPPIQDDSLEAIAFGSDIGSVEMRLEAPMTYIDHYILKGFEQPGREPFFALSRYFISGGELQRRPEVWVGSFALASEASIHVCNAFETPFTSTLKIDTADITFDVCRRPGSGETTAYRVLKVTVSDNNPALPSPIDLTLTTRDGIEQFLYLFIFHHNSCDAFSLELPGATYAAVSSETFTLDAACRAVRAIPARNEIFGDPNRFKIKFRRRYGDGDWLEGYIESEQRGHIFANRVRPE